MTAKDVVVTARSYSGGSVDVESRLVAAGLRVVRGPADHDLAVLRDLLAGAVGWIAGTGPVGPEHLDAAPQLRVLARYGVGVDAVDLAAAAARGVVVTNTPGANSTAVAEHALALLLAALRNVVRDDRRVRQGGSTVTRAREISGLKVGILGLGRIGRALCDRLRALGVTVLAADPFLSADQVRAAGAEPADLPTMAAECDAVSLHAPGETTVVDDALLALFRPGGILVNTARAVLVDEAAVARALREERLGCYATDDLGPGGQDNVLLAADLQDRVIVTPHSAAQTVEAVDNMGTGATEAVLDVLAGRTPRSVVPPPSPS